MPRISIKRFGGIKPKYSPRALPEHNAQVSSNTNHVNPALRAWKNNLLITTLAKSGTLKSIYLLGTSTWLHWTEDVDVVRAPVAGDTTDRTYFSGLDAPRVTNQSLADSSVVTSGSITGATQANPVVITDVSHGLFTGMEISIDNIVGMTELNGREFTITVLTDDTFELDSEDGTGHTAYTSGGDWTRILNRFPEDSYKIGVPTPTVAPIAALVGSHTAPANTAYVYTFVNSWGEESAPSPASNIVLADFLTGTVDLTAMEAAPGPDDDYAPITLWRIYRIATGTTDSEYLFVAEVTINTSTPQYNDDVDDADLGEVLPTNLWSVPPVDLIGLVSMANGILAGFRKNQIYFSASFLPYAWPSVYSLTTDFPIVGLGTFGQSLVVTTTERPYLVTGVDPANMTMAKLPYWQPCLSKRSIVSLTNGVAYSAPDGIFFIGETGANLITEDHYTRDEWQLLIPNICFAGYYDRRYVIIFDSVDKMIIIDPINKEVSELDLDIKAIYADPEGDKLYLNIQDPMTFANDLYEFNSDATRFTYNWKSKQFTKPHDIVFPAGQIFGDFTGGLTQQEINTLNAQIAAIIVLNDALIATGDLLGHLNGKQINLLEVNGSTLNRVPTVPVSSTYVFKLHVDTVEIFSATIVNDSPFRITPVKGKTFELEISGDTPVEEIRIATSIRDLME